MRELLVTAKDMGKNAVSTGCDAIALLDTATILGVNDRVQPTVQ
ncbi:MULTISPECIES: hypothetical protein [unclassified Microcoleus]